MHCIIVVVFDSEFKASEGRRILLKWTTDVRFAYTQMLFC